MTTHPPHPSDGPPVRVHLTAATLDAAAAVCEVRGLPHLVARLDRAANEIRSQEDMEAEPTDPWAQPIPADEPF